MKSTCCNNILCVWFFKWYKLLWYSKFQVGCPKNSECKTAKESRYLNPRIESKLSRDNLVDSSRVILCSFAFRVWTDCGKLPEKHGMAYVCWPIVICIANSGHLAVLV